ncbi:PREDICTED: uncharacterized protein LOC104715296, partial [Camelina sativa]|uniref:Uncharacterized protein LOC104715296 n=1 Tax=Camelina sativa TaxID=90675 RepID=A0ABM0TT99_CAMSA
SNRGDAFQGEGPNVMSSSSLQDESLPSPGMNSFDLNTNSEDASFNSSQRPMGVKKAKRKQQSEEQFKQLMEQNDKLIKAITKGTAERNEIQRQKVEVQRMKQENKILFTDLSTVTDPACRAYIENERAIILRRRAATNQNEEHGEGSQSQYFGSQYRASQNQEDLVQGEHVQGQQSQGEDQPNFSQYYDYLSGNNFPGN